MNIEVKNKIVKDAISLERYGLHELSWHRKDAENLINSIMSEEIGVLGGDVYRLIKNKLKPLYENWYCEQEDNESKESFILRSKHEALEYIQNFPSKNNEEVFFSIIFTEEIC